MGEDYAVVDAGGLGYRLKIPASSASSLASVSTFNGVDSSRTDGRGDVRLYTVCRFRDEQLHLYGFVTIEERDIFERIIGVSGVGPAIALAVLSGIPIEEFRSAVLLDQPRVLERIKGVGRKTAQRLVLELKEVLGSSAGPTQIPTGAIDRAAHDAVLALEAIGFSRHEAEHAVRRVQREHPEAGVEELVRIATRRPLA